jgi:hypothetical protein
MIDEVVIKIFTTQASITGDTLDFKHDVLDSEKSDIKSSIFKIEDKKVLCFDGFVVETVDDDCSS